MKHLRTIALFAAFAPFLLLVNAARADDTPERIAFGEEVDISDYLVPGKTVIFDFTSHFCPPCERISPFLHKLHAARDDIVVVEVDINRKDVRGIDWQSPVAKQYGMNSIPHFKIYGPDGKLTAEGEKAYKMVIDWIQE